MIDAYHVYQYLKDHYVLQTLYHDGDCVAQTDVRYGKAATSELCVHEDIEVLLADGNYRKEVALNDESPIAPIDCEEPLGVLHVLDDAGNVKADYPLYAKAAIDRDWFAYVMQAWELYAIVLMLIAYFLYRGYGEALRRRIRGYDLMNTAKQAKQDRDAKSSVPALKQATALKAEIASNGKASSQIAPVSHSATPSDKNSDHQHESKHSRKSADQTANVHKSDMIANAAKAKQADEGKEAKKANRKKKASQGKETTQAKKANQAKKTQKGNKAAGSHKANKTNRKQKTKQSKGKQKSNIQYISNKSKKKG